MDGAAVAAGGGFLNMSAQWTGVYCGFPFLHFPNGVPTTLSPSLPHWYILRVHRIDVLHLEKELHLELIESTTNHPEPGK